MTYRIYCLKDPTYLEIRYIGVTTSSLNVRLSQHIWDSKHRNGTHKRNWIKQLLKENQKPIIEMIEYCVEKNWEQREKYWINFYSDLTNTHEGGKGVVMNRKTTSIERSSQAKFRTVIQLNFLGEIVNRFESVKAARDYLGLKSSASITNVLKKSGNTKACRGFLWIYEEDYQKQPLDIPTYRKKKVIYNDSIEFESAKECAAFLNINPSSISMICSGKRKSKKYNIRYKTDKDIV